MIHSLSSLEGAQIPGYSSTHYVFAEWVNTWCRMHEGIKEQMNEWQNGWMDKFKELMWGHLLMWRFLVVVNIISVEIWSWLEFSPLRGQGDCVNSCADLQIICNKLVSQSEFSFFPTHTRFINCTHVQLFIYMSNSRSIKSECSNEY